MTKNRGQTKTLLVGRGTLATAGIFGWILIFFFVFQGTALGQSSTYARLVGTVTDQTGAVLPGVIVTAMAKSTNATSEVVTNDRGNYVIDKLIPGLYNINAELPGFKVMVVVDIPLEVSQVARVDFKLEPGEIADLAVTVIGYTPVINTDDAQLGTVVDENRILDLPLRDRNLVKLAYLTTGATHESSVVGENSSAYGGSYPSFNGLFSFYNQITLDGSNNQSAVTQRPIVEATPETVQEFKVITNNYSAEYGKAGGAVISMLSKSGSNELHGHAWYYFRDEALDAANFFTNRSQREKLPVNYQVFGGSIGGPVIKDRTFFHAHFERFIDDFERVDFATVPSMALRGGDLQGAGAFGQIPQIYNPFDVVDGERTPFGGNQIPRSLWNPIYSKVMELLPPPEPNVPGASARNYSYPNTRNTRLTKYSIRGDHQLAGDDSLFGRFSWQSTPEILHSGRIGLPDAELHGISRRRTERNRGWQTAIGWVKPLGPNLVTELNASIWRFAWLFSEPLHQKNIAEQLGYDDADRHPALYPDGSRGPGNVPGIYPRDYTAWEGATTQPLSDWGFSLKHTASWRRGDHYFKFGVEHTRNLDVNQSAILSYSGGGDNFEGYQTGQILRDGAGMVTGASFGEPWADFMLGLPERTSGNSLGLAAAYVRFNQSHYNAFVNDDWKLGPNLTLNLGLRWEQPLPPHYEGTPDGSIGTDYFYCGVDFSQAQGRIDPVQTVPQGFDIPRWEGSGLAVPFQNLSRRSCYEPTWSYFAPRFGLAWRMFGNNRTVLRLGAGLNYNQVFSLFRAQPLSPAQGQVSVIVPRGTETPSHFLGQRLNLPTQVNTIEHRTNRYSELEWEEGRVASYNLSIQHEIFNATKLEVGYVGNQGRHIAVVSGFNVAMPEGYVVPLIDGSTVALTSDPITAGPRPWVPGDDSPRSWSGQRARRPYPQLAWHRLLRPDGNTNYNSLQAKLERRFRDNLALSLGYTWSKAMSLNFNGNWVQTFTPSYYERHNLKSAMRHDRSQAFYASSIWDLPFFRRGEGVGRTLLGGWKATTIVTLTSGADYFIWYGRDLWNQGISVAPDRIADGYLGEGERSVDRWFDTSAFVAPVYDRGLCQGADICHEAAQRALGNSADRPLRYDGVPLVDISLHKKFAFGEEKSLDFRVDFFNAFNHAIFSAPFGNIASPAAGRVFGAANARQIQFGFRFSF